LSASEADPAFPRHRFGWWADFALGARLTLGGGRTSWARLLLGAVGIGLATAVLLVAASVNHIVTDRDARIAASAPLFAGFGDPAAPHAAPLQYIDASDTEFRDLSIDGAYVRATGPNSPVPPGVTRLPGPGQVVVSPALARLLDSADGALLRPRLPADVIGQIGPAGLSGPQELSFFAGISPAQVGPDTLVDDVYQFGLAGGSPESRPVLALLIVGAVALLVPILIMISVCSRIAGAARDRRLAALRLVGASSRQARRIAAAESLVPALAGLLFGGALFLVFREVAPNLRVFGFSVFTSDVAVPLPLAALVVATAPVLAVGSSLFAMRRVMIEPLGLVRARRPVRRRLWWRLALTVGGVLALLQAAREDSDTTTWTVTVALGASLLLIGVPTMLPYLLERSVTAIRGGPPAWQLAVRKLQLDSGTPARVVSGVTVVLAGAIALQTVLAATAGHLGLAPTPTTNATPGFYYVVTDHDVQDQVDAAIQKSGVARSMYPMTIANTLTAVAVTNDTGTSQVFLTDSLGIATCTVIERLAVVPGCRDGDVFATPGAGSEIPPGTRLNLTGGIETASPTPTLYGSWRVPTDVRPIALSANGGDPEDSLEYLVTPGAISGVALPPDPDAWTLVWTDPADQNAVEVLRDAVAAQPLRATVISDSLGPVLDTYQSAYTAVRTGLLIGALFTLALAGISMLVLAVEQVRERRRPLAMLSAAGVPQAVLARSLLLQIALPVVVSVVAAVGTGIVLAGLVLHLSGTHLALDWAVIGTFSGVAAALVLLVTAATLPALRSATRLSALRTE
jgi:hypothetical protein